MRYLCLIYDNEQQLNAMSRPESDAFMAEYFQFTEGIKASRHFVAGEALESVQAATTLRKRSGKLSTTDGPFAETKEQLGGFFLIEAHDLNEALRIAGRIPSVRTGSVEVRPVMDLGGASGAG